jgi:hypothetical protein
MAVKQSLTNLVLLTFVAALATSACDENVDELTGRGARSGSNDPGADDPSKSGILTCEEGPTGRSYTNFDGLKLEAARTNENTGVNRARVKPYAALEKEYQRVLGVAPPSIKTSAASFDTPAARWFSEPQYSGVSLYAVANISFEGCSAYTKGKPEFAAAPTEESANKACTDLMRKAWSRSPSPEEIAGCANLAVKGLADEKDVNRRWAYTCASVLSASQFLTF